VEAESEEGEEVSARIPAWLGWSALATLVVIGTFGVWMFGGAGVQIEPRCSIRGTGDVSCRFRNAGWSPGSRCYSLVLRNQKTGELASDWICSDRIWPGSSMEAGTVIPNVLKLCGGSLDNCALTVHRQ
jgi:hypothetical protein